MNFRFAFVVLNYAQCAKTELCVDNLLLKLSGDYMIIIVDNGSPDGSGILLEDKYIDYENVKCILLQKNQGFSAGHNVGFQYAKTHGYDFIALINNDTEIISENICNTIAQDYLDYDFSVLGPHIDNPDGDMSCNVNPYTIAQKTDKQFVKMKRLGLLKTKLWLWLFKINVGWLIYNLKTRWDKKNYSYNTGNLDEVPSKRVDDIIILNCCLHGSYLIFSPNYINEYNGLDQVTFLYGEEWLLYRKCQIDKKIMLYDSRIRIWHDEHAVQNTISPKQHEKYYWRLVREAESTSLILDYVKRERKNGRCFDKVESNISISLV